MTNKIPDWVILNNKIIDENGKISDLSKDKEAAKSYLNNYVYKNLKRFETLRDKLDYLIENNYYEKEFLDKYSYAQIKEVYQYIYNKKFEFPSYIGAFKFYNDYALKSNTENVFLETYEDRLAVNALYHANGDFDTALELAESLISQNFTPATPTLLNTGKKNRGEFVSCFLLEGGDSLNDISRISEFSMQLSKRGGGVAINLSNLRAKGESIKGVQNAVKGVVGVMKLLDNNFRYADQMGQRPGAGAVYLNVFHADILDFLETKKLNADDDIRVKTLSLGVVMPNKMLELAKNGEDMYVFYPKTVYDATGVEFADISIKMDHWYDKLVANPSVRKRKINPRALLETIAAIQGESGYPYIMFSDNVNEQNPMGELNPVKFSNLCTEILQPTKTSHYADYDKREDDDIGLDVSCNLASGHIGNMMKNKALRQTVESAMEVMNSVSRNTNISSVPAVARANKLNHSIGLGMMGLHGYLAENYIVYGSEESLEFVDVFFNIINYYSLKYSNEEAIKTGQVFYNFSESTYASGEYFSGRGQILPASEKVKSLFEGIYIPTDEDWQDLKISVMSFGLYNSHRLAIAPNGSTAYIMSATPSLTPIKQLVEERTYGNSKTYFPAPALDVAEFMYETAYKMDTYKTIDVIATAQKHVDQGISFELCITSDKNTRDLVKYYLYAHHQGIKTLYYTRTQKLKVDECLSCAV